MSMRKVVFLAAFVAVVACGPPVMAITWNEVGDAGDVPSMAQVTTGTGALTAITGSVNHYNDADMFRIFITGGGSFSALATPANGTNLQLFLFDEDGYGVYWDSRSGGNDKPWLPANVTHTPTESGIYYLAISVTNNDPIIVSSSAPQSYNNYIFGQLDGYTRGADGPAADMPIADWDDDGWDDEPLGGYNISLTGTQFANYSPKPPNGGNGVIPEPITMASLALGLAAVGRYARRRRRQ